MAKPLGKPSIKSAIVPLVKPHGKVADNRQITVGVAFATWLAGWLGGNVLASVFLGVSGKQHLATNLRPGWVTLGLSLCLWVPQLVALFVVSRNFASGAPFVDYKLAFRPIDLVGIPIGLACQMLLVGLYWPLRHAWPSTFSQKALEENARDLYRSVHGIWIAVLVVLIAVAAPIVEELVYRGLIHAALMRKLSTPVAVIASAAFFALIHFRPIELPGLFAFGVVLAICLSKTGRIGMSIAAHMTFNATALYLVSR